MCSIIFHHTPLVWWCLQELFSFYCSFFYFRQISVVLSCWILCKKSFVDIKLTYVFSITTVMTLCHGCRVFSYIILSLDRSYKANFSNTAADTKSVTCLFFTFSSVGPFFNLPSGASLIYFKRCISYVYFGTKNLYISQPDRQ